MFAEDACDPADGAGGEVGVEGQAASQVNRERQPLASPASQSSIRSSFSSGLGRRATAASRKAASWRASSRARYA